MSYRAGVTGQALKRLLGDECKPWPTLTCDVVGCGFQIEVKKGRGGGPPAWLPNKKAPKGWLRLELPDGKPVQHICPACVKAIEGKL